jgi:NAD(P)H-hydrate epimerase
VQAASRIVDLIYVLSTKENQKLIKKLKSQTAEFIPVDKPDFKNLDAVLIGPGLGVSKKTYELTKKVLQSGKKAVLDADSLKILDEKLRRMLRPHHILTPHYIEFKKAFNLTASKQNVLACVKKYGCNIILKGQTDVVAGPWGLALDKNGNAGLTKGGTGDILAGLTAGLLCKNPQEIAAQAAVFAVGFAGDRLYSRQKTFYNSEDILAILPRVLASL